MMMTPKATKTGLSLLVVAALLTVTGLAHAEKALLGTWKAHAMKMKGKTQVLPKGMSVTIEFKKDHTFIGTMKMDIPNQKPRKKVENGTWKVKGKTLTTTAKKTEKMTFAIKGKTLSLNKADRGETLILKRLK